MKENKRFFSQQYQPSGKNCRKNSLEECILTIWQCILGAELTKKHSFRLSATSLKRENVTRKTVYLKELASTEIKSFENELKLLSSLQRVWG